MMQGWLVISKKQQKGTSHQFTDGKVNLKESYGIAKLYFKITRNR